MYRKCSGTRGIAIETLKDELSQRCKIPKNPWQVHWCHHCSSHQNQAQKSRWWYDSLGLYFDWNPASIKTIINWSQCSSFVRLLRKKTFTYFTKKAFAAELKFPNAKEACLPLYFSYGFFRGVQKLYKFSLCKQTHKKSITS